MIAAWIMAIVMTVGYCVADMGPAIDALAYTSQVASVKASSLNVRSGPGTSYTRVTSLSLGEQVVVTDEVTGADGSTWAQITDASGNQLGYVLKSYLGMATVYSGLSDSSFESMMSSQGFPESYKPYLRSLHAQYPNWTFTAVHTGLDWETVIANESVVGRNLVYTSSKSSWKSTEDGAYDWGTGSWPGFDGSAWVAASEDIIRYYMDPRNFLDSVYVFQFLDHKYNASVHTAAGLESMLKGTFMESSYSGSTSSGSSGSSGSGSSGTTFDAPSIITDANGVQLIGPGYTVDISSTSPGDSSTAAASTAAQTASPAAAQTSAVSSSPSVSSGPGASVVDPSSSSGSSGGVSYVDILIKAAQESGVNPYVLASMIIQEQGQAGTSPLISGTYSGYSGIYNFFNVEAYQSGSMSAVQRGLWWASQSGSYDRPWSSREKAIVGGAKFYGENYTYEKQNTFYLKKFNVLGTNLYKHQFMTNIQGAASEGYHLSKAYTDEVRTAAHNFEIPVYTGMPATAEPCPTKDGSPNNKLSGLGIEGFSITPTFNTDTLSYDLIVGLSVETVNVWAQAMDTKAQISGIGNVSLSQGSNTVNITVVAENGSDRTYTINIVRQSGGPTYTYGLGTSSGTGGSSYGPGMSTTGASSGTVSTGTTSTGSTDTVVLVGPGGTGETSVTQTETTASTAAETSGSVVFAPPQSDTGTVQIQAPGGQ